MEEMEWEKSLLDSVIWRSWKNGIIPGKRCISATAWIMCGLVLIICAVSIVVAGGSITPHLVRLRKMFPALIKRKKRGGA